MNTIKGTLSRRAVIIGGTTAPALALPFAANAATPSPEIVRHLSEALKKQRVYDQAYDANPKMTDAESDVFYFAKEASYRLVLDFPATCLEDVLAKLQAARANWYLDEDDGQYAVPCRIDEEDAHTILSDLWRIAGGTS